MTSQLNDLKSQHIADEVDDKFTKNSGDVLSLRTKLVNQEDLTNDLERKISYFRGKHGYDRDGLQNFFSL